ncbi:MAG TPA: hypothetical protein VFA09_01405 [Ktedonobacteraceae bacterium]|nr:hypothetical protein [Ktedonobacteraceae bacterium]HZU65907.1 hypothetical protein [Ktedonobacteraceae bacterium]
MTSRKPFAEMSSDEIRLWIQQTREELQRKIQRERVYLDRRAAQGIHTLTDDTYEADLLLEADLLMLLDELEASL